MISFVLMKSSGGKKSSQAKMGSTI